MGLPEETSKFCFKACFQHTGLDIAYKKKVLIFLAMVFTQNLKSAAKTRKRFVRAIIAQNMF